MNSIAILVAGAVIGSGSLLWNSTNNKSSNNVAADNAPVIEAAGLSAAGNSDRTAFEQAGVSLPGLSSNFALITPQRPDDNTPLVLSTSSSLPTLNQGDKQNNDDKIDPEIEQELTEELQKLVEEYWVAKINDYRRRVDEAVKGADKEELDRLRVRWSLLEEEGMDGLLSNFDTRVSARINKDGVASGFNMSSNTNGNGLNSPNFSVEVETDNSESDIDNLDEIIAKAMAQAEKSIAKANVNITNASANAEASAAKANAMAESLMKQLESSGLKATMTIIDEDSDADVYNVETDNGMISISTTRDSADGKGRSLSISANGNIIGFGNDEMKELMESMPELAQGMGMVIAMKTDKSEEVNVNVNSTQDSESTTRTRQNVVVRERHINKDNSKNVAVEQEIVLNGKGKSLNMSFNSNSIFNMLKGMIAADESESAQIITGTWGIAERNRAELDRIKADMMLDIETFIVLVEDKVADFAREHEGAIDGDLEKVIAEKRERAGEGLASSEVQQVLGPLYEIIAEPIIMLYNGSDISGMLTSAIAEPVAGVTLNANSTLKQSYPNPARNEATIEFSLNEQSPNTTLRLFNTNGEQVRTMDLGAQAKGDHSVVLDLKNLASGTYLYHLTIGTSKGEQVFSKTMQIAR